MIHLKNTTKVLIALFVFIFFSCSEEEEITVGSTVLPGSNVEFELEKLVDAIEFKQLDVPKIRSNSLPFYKLGNAKGLKHEIVLKPITAINNAVRSLNNELFVKFKEANLILGYRYNTLSDDGDSATENISILSLEEGNQGEEDLSINVNLLDNQILLLNRDTQSQVGYFTDGSSTTVGASISTTPSESTLASNFSISVPTEDFTVNTANNSQIASNSLRLSKNIEDAGGAIIIPLAKEKFQNYFRQSEDDVLLTRDELVAKSVDAEFGNTFQAIHLEVLGDQNSLVELLSNSLVRSRIQVIFEVTTESGEPAVINDTVNDNVISSSTFEVPFDLVANENGSQVINLITDNRDNTNNTENLDVTTLRNGINGSVMQIQLLPEESDNNLKAILDKKIIVSEATLRFTAKTSETAFEELPNRLALNFSESTGSITDFDLFNTNNPEETLFTNHILEKKQMGDNVIYDIIVTEHIQQILNQSEGVDASEQFNRNLILSIYNDEIAPFYSRVKSKQDNSNTIDGFFVFGGVLYNTQKVPIYNNMVSDDELKPKLILKFTPSN